MVSPNFLKQIALCPHGWCRLVSVGSERIGRVKCFVTSATSSTRSVSSFSRSVVCPSLWGTREVELSRPGSGFGSTVLKFSQLCA